MTDLTTWICVGSWQYITMDILLYYGADPNMDTGNGRTVFTSIIESMLEELRQRNPMYSLEFCEEAIRLLMNNGARTDIGNPTTRDLIVDWPTKYSYGAIVNNLDDIISTRPDKIASADIMSIIRKIKNEYKEEIKDINMYQAKKKEKLAHAISKLNLNVDMEVLSWIGDNINDNDTNNLLNEYYYRIGMDNNQYKINKRELKRKIKAKKIKRKKQKKMSKSTKRIKEEHLIKI